MSYMRYELLKAEWISKHPDATPQQHQQAMKNIAKACGI